MLFAALAACGDQSVTSPNEALAAPTEALMAKGGNSGGGGSSADATPFLLYQRSSSELWAYDKRPEMGIGVHLPQDYSDTSQREVDRLKSLGVRVVRVTIYWDWFENDSRYGAYWDQLFARFHQQGLEVTVTVHRSPERYSWNNRQEAYAAYAQFMAGLAARYPRVLYWQLWNEMDAGHSNLFGANDGRPSSPQGVSMLDRGKAYAEMLKLAYPAIKRANPNAWVLTGGMINVTDFPRGIYEGGGKDFFDFMAIHSYEPVITGFKQRAVDVRGVMAGYKDDMKPLWSTEFGVDAGMYVRDHGYPNENGLVDATSFDNHHTRVWQNAANSLTNDKLYTKALGYQLYAGTYTQELDPARLKLPSGHTQHDYGFGMFRWDFVTPRPTYTWWKGSNVNRDIGGKPVLTSDVTIDKPGNLRPIGYQFTMAQGKMTIKNVSVDNRFPTVIRFE
jgi:hypothetical protein